MLRQVGLTTVSEDVDAIVPVPVAEKRGRSPCAIGAHTIGTVGSSWNRHGSLVSCSDENKGGAKPATYADPNGNP